MCAKGQDGEGVRRTFHLPQQLFWIISHIHNGEERLGLRKSNHEVSYVAIAQRDVVTDAASQQAFNVDI